MENPGSNLSLEQIERLMEVMKKHGFSYLKYQGIELKADEKRIFYPLAKSDQKEDLADKKPKKKEPTADELLLNPYAGIEQ